MLKLTNDDDVIEASKENTERNQENETDFLDYWVRAHLSAIFSSIYVRNMQMIWEG